MPPEQKTLTQIDPDAIAQNPVNPRLIFREAEMNQLLDSIREVGIQVPLSVFRAKRGYVLLDGERRWRCAKKLNLSTVPVLVQPEPSPLENLLTMFNIHNVRSDWDLMPMALKLKEVRQMLADQGQDPKPAALAGLTGVPLPTVRRALELVELPQRYQDLLIVEAEKPRDKQTITADVFVEVNKAKRVIETYQPKVFEEVSQEDFVDSMVDKYQRGVVNNLVRFRDISKIARAELAGGDSAVAAPMLVRLVRDPTYEIEAAYHHTVEAAYAARDINSKVTGLREKLSEWENAGPLPAEVRENLEGLAEAINRLLAP